MYNKSSIIATSNILSQCSEYFMIILGVIIMIFSEKLQLIRKNKGLTQE